MNPFIFLATPVAFWPLHPIPGKDWRINLLFSLLGFPVTKEKEVKYECFLVKFSQPKINWSPDSRPQTQGKT
jgi:hypothetical protein